MIRFLSRSVIVDDLDIAGAVGCPDEAHPPLLVDPDAVLAAPVTRQRLEAVAGRRLQVLQDGGPVQLCELAQGRDFLKDASNIVFVGPNGVGKTLCATNIGYQAVLAGHTALFITAGQLLGELAALDNDSALRRRLRQYAAPELLVIDEVGYLSYSNRHADLLFELVSRRYQHKSTVVTTNRAFADWGEVFPNAACVVSLIDRLMHRAEVVRIDGDSYRAKEADERRAQRAAERAKAAAAKPRRGAK
jgi:phage tail protein X